MKLAFEGFFRKSYESVNKVNKNMSVLEMKTTYRGETALIYESKCKRCTLAIKR